MVPIDKAANWFISNCTVTQDGDTVVAVLAEEQIAWWEGRATAELVRNICTRLVRDVCPGARHVRLQAGSGHILRPERALPTEAQRNALIILPEGGKVHV